MENIYQVVKAAGIEIDHHESDLYIPVNEFSMNIVREYKFKDNVTRFRSRIDGAMWYDIPFAYEPFWELRRIQSA